MNNPAFWRALHSLAHPLTIISVVALVVNDHWLRWTLPSWWTGKLGDFAWLLFAPFICTLALSWLIPKRWQQQERMVGIVSITFIGAWFALAKTVPTVHALTVNTLDSIVGWQGGLRMDATDLLTLPALLMSWHIWRTVRNTPPRVPVGYVVTALGIMGTLATSCIVDRGIVAFCQLNDTLYAFTEDMIIGGIYRSEDRGLIWSQIENYDRELVESCSESIYWKSGVGIFGPYEIVAGEGVYRLPNTLLLDLSARYHDSYKMLRQAGQPIGIPCGNPKPYSSGPIDAVYDEQTDTLLLAMGQEGILVVNANDDWQWITIGNYEHIGIDWPSSTGTVLQPVFITALWLALLAVTTLALTGRQMRWYETVGLNAGWLFWLLLWWLSSSILHYILVRIGMPLLVIVMLFAIFGVIKIFQRRSSGANIMLMVLALGIAMLYLLPYVLWVRRTVPNHGTASLFALILVGGAMFSAVPYYRWRFPARKKKKQPDEGDSLPPPNELVDTYIVEDAAD